jgi:hypothetical protein
MERADEEGNKVDSVYTQDRLLVAASHVVAGRCIVGRQRAIIARLEGNRCRTVEAVRTLELFERTLAIFEEHHQDIVNEIAESMLKVGGGRGDTAFDAFVHVRKLT